MAKGLIVTINFSGKECLESLTKLFMEILAKYEESEKGLISEGHYPQVQHDKLVDNLTWEIEGFKDRLTVIIRDNLKRG